MAKEAAMVYSLRRSSARPLSIFPWQKRGHRPVLMTWLRNSKLAFIMKYYKELNRDISLAFRDHGGRTISFLFISVLLNFATLVIMCIKKTVFMKIWIRKYEPERTNTAISSHACQIARGLITVTKLGNLFFQIYQQHAIN